MYTEFFGQAVTKRLKDNKISLAELAKRTGVTRAHLFNVIHGKSSPTLEMMTLISVHLEVPLSVLLDDPEFRNLGCSEGHEYTVTLRPTSEGQDEQNEPTKAENSTQNDKSSDISVSAVSTLVQNDLVILQNLHEIRQLLLKKALK